MLPRMVKTATKKVSIAYVVLAILMAPMMCISAAGKLMLHPGAVHVINEVAGVPLNFFPLLAACEIAGGLGLVAGIFRPKLGVAAGAGLVLYFLGAIVAHVRVGDWEGVTAPITPLLLATTALALGVLRTRQA